MFYTSAQPLKVIFFLELSTTRDDDEKLANTLKLLNIKALAWHSISTLSITFFSSLCICLSICQSYIHPLHCSFHWRSPTYTSSLSPTLIHSLHNVTLVHSHQISVPSQCTMPHPLSYSTIPFLFCSSHTKPPNHYFVYPILANHKHILRTCSAILPHLFVIAVLHFSYMSLMHMAQLGR